MISNKIARQLAKKYNINLQIVPLQWWKFGLETELEHGTKTMSTNITNDDMGLTAKIVIVHLIENYKYYEYLSIMESIMAEEPNKNIFMR